MSLTFSHDLRYMSISERKGRAYNNLLLSGILSSCILIRVFSPFDILSAAFLSYSMNCSDLRVKVSFGLHALNHQ